MFAIVKTGGKQYKVSPKDVIKVEKLDVAKDQNLVLDQVLMLGDGKSTHIGTPLVEGASVHAVVLDHIKAEKVIIFKKKRRHTYRRKKGHRQMQTVLRILDVCEKGAKPSVDPTPAAAKKAALKTDTAKQPKEKSEDKSQTKAKVAAGAASPGTSSKAKPEANPAPKGEKKSAAKKPAAKTPKE